MAVEGPLYSCLCSLQWGFAFSSFRNMLFMIYLPTAVGLGNFHHRVAGWAQVLWAIILFTRGSWDIGVSTQGNSHVVWFWWLAHQYWEPSPRIHGTKSTSICEVMMLFFCILCSLSCLCQWFPQTGRTVTMWYNDNKKIPCVPERHFMPRSSPLCQSSYLARAMVCRIEMILDQGTC